MRRINILLDPPSFFDFLKRLVQIISEKHWEAFWKIKGEKFVEHPERIAKGILGACIAVSFGDVAFIGPETKFCNGYIDLFTTFHIVEIKIVGPGWGIGWAKSGLTQLDKYMKIHKRNESYLVVLDGRKTDKGEQLENEYQMGHGKVYVLTSKIYWH